MPTRVITDLHVHSRFARACSKYLTLPSMVAWAQVKGIDLLGTADFTHPVWLSEIRDQLSEVGEGIYELKPEYRVELPYQVANPRPVRFLLTHEIATIWRQGDKTRRMHTVLVAPDMVAAQQLTKHLEPHGKLGSDGRPILGMSARELALRAWEVDQRMLVIPAHAWTPWFAVFGAKSGFDSIEECFGHDLADRIPAIETGLSSDPLMNWQLSALDDYALISTSDAHSHDNLGREATVFHREDELSFELVSQMIWEGAPNKVRERSPNNFLDYTIEFFPEEGRYHHDGHRACDLNWSPKARQRHNGICPHCGRPVTVGVLSRVDELADREHGFVPEGAPGYNYIVPIRDIGSAMLGKGKKTKAVDTLYTALVTTLGPEFDVLLDAPLDQIAAASSNQFAEIVNAMRNGDISMTPGYDGVYGTLQLPQRSQSQQHSLFQAT